MTPRGRGKTGTYESLGGGKGTRDPREGCAQETRRGKEDGPKTGTNGSLGGGKGTRDPREGCAQEPVRVCVLAGAQTN